MLVILKDNVKALGKLGKIVKVKSGYARNFLFPQKKAIRATNENIAKLEERRSLLEKENSKKLSFARELSTVLSNRFVILVKQASEDGKIFGSVTAREIAKSLSSQGFKIDHHKILFSRTTIKYLGEYQVNIELHSEVVVPIVVHIVKSELDALQVKQTKNKTQQES